MQSNQASKRAKVLVEALRDVLRNEDAWQIAEDHLAEAFEQGYKAGCETVRFPGEWGVE